MANPMETDKAAAQAAQQDTSAGNLLAEVHAEMKSISLARQHESYLDRGIDYFYDRTVADLKHLTKIENDLVAA